MQSHLATYNKSIIFQTTGLGPKYIMFSQTHPTSANLATTSAHKKHHTNKYSLFIYSFFCYLVGEIMYSRRNLFYTKPY